MIVWRVWFRTYDGSERYFDVESYPARIGGWEAIRLAHQAFRAEPGPDPMRGWWMDRWQPLIVPAGTDPPSLRRRVRLAARRARRRLRR